MARPTGKLIPVDFAARRRLAPTPSVPKGPIDRALMLQRLARVKDVLVFWKPPTGRGSGEYLGGRWDWGWTLFIWTTEKAVGPMLADLVGERGYVPQRIGRAEFAAFLERVPDIGGVLLDGELEDQGQVIRAEPDQMIRRDEVVTALSPAASR